MRSNPSHSHTSLFRGQAPRRDGCASRSLVCFVGLLLCSLLIRAPASAEEPNARTERAYTADPNAESFGYEYRGAVRGRFADVFSLYGESTSAGYSVAVSPFIELHEPRRSHQVLPSQYWRARIALAQSYGFVWGERRLHIDLVLSHESDHETAHAYSRPGFLALNDLTVRLRYAQRSGPVSWGTRLDGQAYFLSCTDPARTTCENFQGDTSVGGQLELLASLPDARVLAFAPFVSAHASGIASNGLVRSEARLSARLGITARLGDSNLSLFMLGFWGNDLGIVRNRSLSVVGAGVAFVR